MDHRTSINEVHQFLENQRKERLESAVSLMDISDTQLKNLLYEARLAQHSLVRGSIAEIENTRKIESATLVLESRLDELSKSTLGSYVKKDTSDIQDKSFDSGYHEAGDQRTNAMDLQAKADKRSKGVGSAVKRLVKEALDGLDETEEITEDEYLSLSEDDQELYELSSKTLTSYLRKNDPSEAGAKKRILDKGERRNFRSKVGQDALFNKETRAKAGANNATARLSALQGRNPLSSKLKIAQDNAGGGAYAARGAGEKNKRD
jgi:hypothetical protein